MLLTLLGWGTRDATQANQLVNSLKGMIVDAQHELDEYEMVLEAKGSQYRPVESPMPQLRAVHSNRLVFLDLALFLLEQVEKGLNTVRARKLRGERWLVASDVDEEVIIVIKYLATWLVISQAEGDVLGFVKLHCNLRGSLLWEIKVVGALLLKAPHDSSDPVYTGVQLDVFLRR